MNNPNPAAIKLDQDWSVKKIRTFKINRHEIEVSLCQNEASQRTTLGDWQTQIGKDFSGDCEYYTSFHCSADQIYHLKLLDLGDVKYGCEVILNDTSIGKKCWSPYQFPIEGQIKEGTNQIRIIVTNTLANQYVHTRFWTKWSFRRLGPYHPRALVFEKDSLESGLFGPVIIR